MDSKKSIKNKATMWAAAAVAAVIFGFLFGQLSVFQSKSTSYDNTYILFFYSDLDGDYSIWESSLGDDLVSQGNLSERSDVLGMSGNMNKISGFVIFSADSYESALEIANSHPEKDDGIELRVIN